MSREDARIANALSDQTWASLRNFQNDIDRIANGGFIVDDGKDMSIVMMVFHMVAGDLHLREAQVLNDE